MGNLFEAIAIFEERVKAGPRSHITVETEPFYYLNEEFNAVTSVRTDMGRQIEDAINSLTKATLSVLPNRQEKNRGKIPDKLIDEPDTLNARTFYFLYRLIGHDVEELAALVEENAEALGDRSDLYWILAENYHYDPRLMLEDMKKGELKPRKSP